jgi:hypothetical protein
MVSKTSRALRFLLNTTTTALMIWAVNQLETDDKKIGFSKKAVKEAAFREIAKDIV